jgi:hypothetical protein
MTPTVRSLAATLSSIRLFFWIAGILLALLAAGSLLPQLDLFHRAWFLAPLGLLAVNTVACVVRRWRGIPWASLVSHAGVLLVLVGGLVSLRLGQAGDLQLREGGPGLRSAWGRDGAGSMPLPFQVSLKRFVVEFHGVGTHHLSLDAGDGRGTESLEVREGGRYRMEGGGPAVEVLRFLPDFGMDGAGDFFSRSRFPNNPALQVRVDGGRPRWVFANFAGIHQDGEAVAMAYRYDPPVVRQYRSTVTLSGLDGAPLEERELWVNRPLRYAGFTLYQSGYDPEDPSVSYLHVSRDPGAGLVFLGGVVLMLGLAATLLQRQA